MNRDSPGIPDRSGWPPFQELLEGSSPTGCVESLPLRQALLRARRASCGCYVFSGLIRKRFGILVLYLIVL